MWNWTQQSRGRGGVMTGVCCRSLCTHGLTNTHTIYSLGQINEYSNEKGLINASTFPEISGMLEFGRSWRWAMTHIWESLVCFCHLCRFVASGAVVVRAGSVWAWSGAGVRWVWLPVIEQVCPFPDSRRVLFARLYEFVCDLQTGERKQPVCTHACLTFCSFPFSPVAPTFLLFLPPFPPSCPACSDLSCIA